MTVLRTTITVMMFKLLVIISGASAGEITLAWDPNSEQNLAGYRLYMEEGGETDGFRRLADIPLDDLDPQAPSFMVVDLKDDTQYRFAISAYTYSDDESGRSNTVCVINGQPCAASSSSGAQVGCFFDILLSTPSAWKIRVPER